MDSHEQHELWDLIKGIRFGMLVARAADGHLHARPLTTQNRDFDATDRRLWFFISRSSELARDLAQDGNVNLSYANTDDDSYVSCSGPAELVEDPARVQALWSTAAEAWFPGGPTDPDLQLLSVRVDHAEYWDVKDSKMVQLFKMAKAAVTGRPPHMSEHREVH